MNRRDILKSVALGLSVPYFGIPKDTFNITKHFNGFGIYYNITKDEFKTRITGCDDYLDIHNICAISDVACLTRQEIEFDLKSLYQAGGFSYYSEINREDFRRTKLSKKDNLRILCLCSYHMNKHKCCNPEQRNQLNKILKEKFPQDLELYQC